MQFCLIAEGCGVDNKNTAVFIKRVRMQDELWFVFPDYSQQLSAHKALVALPRIKSAMSSI